MTVVWHGCSSIVLMPSKACTPQKGSKTVLFMRSSMHFPSSLVLMPHSPVHDPADLFMVMAEHSQYPLDSNIL